MEDLDKHYYQVHNKGQKRSRVMFSGVHNEEVKDGIALNIKTWLKSEHKKEVHVVDEIVGCNKYDKTFDLFEIFFHFVTQRNSQEER
jgi:hypothetical protein